MAWLDRDRMPMLFSVVTSVASGLILAAILYAFRTGNALIWAAVAVLVAAVSWIGIGAISRPRKRSKRAFFVVSAFQEKYYVAAFVERLQNQLDNKSTDLVLKVPERDYDASAQSHHLGRILDRRRDYIGGIIFAGEVHRLRADLITFCRKSRLPVVFTDIEPFAKEDEYPENSAYIGYDTGKLGELAGRWLARHLAGTIHPHVLIIASTEHSVRQERCAQILRAELHDDVTITINDQCAFVRSRAYDAVRAYVRQLDDQHGLDAIFCTNDEMALGAVDALETPSPATKTTVVVGIDGVREAKTLIDKADSPLRATVIQDTDRLAGNVVDLLDKMYRGRAVPKRTILPAEVYEAR
jgi:ABC-type sugar transport system substrate-binding protein